MNQETVIAKNENASITLDADGKIIIDAKKILINNGDSTV